MSRSEPQPKMHWTTQLGVAGVILCVATVATCNVVGWLHTLPGATGIGAAFIAVGLEVVAFVAWEHIATYWRSRDYGRLALTVIGLAVAALVNIEGGHRGLDHLAAPLYAAAEAERRVSQEALDAERGLVEREIAGLQARIDAEAATNPGTTYPGRMAQWRENFEAVTAEDRRQIAARRARLDALPLTVAAARPFPAWGPYALTTAFAFFSLFGLTLFGVKLPGANASAPPPGTELQASVPGAAPRVPRDPVVVANAAYLAAIHSKQARAWRMKYAEGRSFRYIAKELGCSLVHAQRLVRDGEKKLAARDAQAAAAPANNVTPLRPKASAA